MIEFISSLVIAYLLGSISVAIILAKFLKLPDPRNVGSKSAGATNILRTSGKNQALIVLLGDAFKGILAVWIGMALGLEGTMLGWVAFAAVLGHIFPIYFKFRGGKGVATALGAIAALSFLIGLLLIVVWISVAVITRYSSLASLTAVFSAPLFVLFLGRPELVFPVMCIAILVIWKHKNNIQRLKTRTESKIQFST